MKKIILYCLPYAGGSASVYNKWQKFFDNSIELRPIELPGRGKKFSTPFYNTLEEAANNIFKEIKDDINRNRAAFFGHSMGASLVYEIVQKIINSDKSNPVHVFFSGQCPPHIMKKSDIYKLDEVSFKNKILELNGTPKEIYENQELFDIYIPILRADYKLIETHKFSNFLKWNIDITVFHGKVDGEVNMNEALEWSNYTDGGFRFVEFEGGHFFINEKAEDIAKEINSSLKLFLG